MSLIRKDYSFESRARFFGGDSDTSSSTTEIVETNQSGIQNQTGGFGVSSLGDVDVEIQTTDLGAVQGAFDFTQDFSDSAFRFANDAQAQAADLSEAAVQTSQRALATATTGGVSDLAGINMRMVAIVAAAVAAIFVLPQVLRRK